MCLYLYLQWEIEQRKAKISQIDKECGDIELMGDELLREVNLKVSPVKRPIVYRFEKTAGIVSVSNGVFNIKEATLGEDS